MLKLFRFRLQQFQIQVGVHIQLLLNFNLLQVTFDSSSLGDQNTGISKIKCKNFRRPPFFFIRNTTVDFTVIFKKEEDDNYSDIHKEFIEGLIMVEQKTPNYRQDIIFFLNLCISKCNTFYCEYNFLFLSQYIGIQVYL